MNMMMKDSDGKRSSSVTFAWLAFLYVLFAITLGLIKEINIAGYVLKFRVLGADIILSLLAPAFGLYGYRKKLNSAKDSKSQTP